MTTELQNRKLDRAFGHIDIDNDGYIERDDVLGLGARILVGFGEAPTSAKGKAVIDHYDTLWETIVARIDSDRDARISREEYRSGMAAAFIHGPDFDHVFRPAAQAVATLCDTDDDGVVGADEFQTLQSAFGTSTADAQAAFNKLDTNGSGTLTVDELIEAAREFFLGDDPSSRGNWLFGPI